MRSRVRVALLAVVACKNDKAPPAPAPNDRTFTRQDADVVASTAELL